MFFTNVLTLTMIFILQQIVNKSWVTKLKLKLFPNFLSYALNEIKGIKLIEIRNAILSLVVKQ